jgi:hypothetical protein
MSDDHSFTRDIGRPLLYGAAAIAVVALGYKPGQNASNLLLFAVVIAARSYVTHNRQSERVYSSTYDKQRAWLLEGLVAKMLTYRDRPDPDVVERVKLAFDSGIFRDAGLEAPARVWLARANKEYRQPFIDTVEGAEFAYAASGSEEDGKLFSSLCSSDNHQIRSAAANAVRRRKLAEQDDGTGELLAMNDTLRDQHTSLIM